MSSIISGQPARMPGFRRGRDRLAQGDTYPRLGLVCITASEQIRYRTVTRKRLLTLNAAERQRLLRELYAANVAVLRDAIAYCQASNLVLYRLTSGLFPFSDERYGEEVLRTFTEELARIGRTARRHGIRLVLHPDQYVVLNSEAPVVVANSIKILEAQATVLDLLEQPRSPWAAIQLHGGKGDRARELARTVRELPDGIRHRLALENDERAYGAEAMLRICQDVGTPMVFDAHHHLVHERLASYEDPSISHYVDAAAGTWPRRDWQLVHISNGRSSLLDPSHSDMIVTMPSAYRRVPFIEIEAKAKEVAIADLRRRWLAA